MEKKQTAMTKLFSIIEGQIGKSFPEEIKTHFIQMEREQIEEAFVAGDERGTKGIPFNAEQYYTQTFKP